MTSIMMSYFLKTDNESETHNQIFEMELNSWGSINIS